MIDIDSVVVYMNMVVAFVDIDFDHSVIVVIVLVEQVVLVCFVLEEEEAISFLDVIAVVEDFVNRLYVENTSYTDHLDHMKHLSEKYMEHLN